MIPRGQPDIGYKEIEVAYKCLIGGELALGPQVEEFEHELAKMHGRKYAIATSNGWSALFLIFKSLYKQGRVMMPTTVCKSVLYSTQQAGFSPLLVDCNEYDYNINLNEVIEYITDDTVAILVPHLRGIPSDMDALVGISAEFGVPIIEDCAQSLGSRYKNKLTGTFGLASMFSFFPTKIVSSIDGGMILTDDYKLYRTALNLRYQNDESNVAAYNFKLNNLNAIIGLEQLHRLDYFIERRWKVYNNYKSLFGDDLYTLVRDKEIVPDKFMLMGADVTAIREKLKDVVQPIKTVHLLHRLFGMPDSDFPNAVNHHNYTLALPIYPTLLSQQIRRIYDAYSSNSSA